MVYLLLVLIRFLLQEKICYKLHFFFLDSDQSKNVNSNTIGSIYIYIFFYYILVNKKFDIEKLFNWDK